MGGEFFQYGGTGTAADEEAEEADRSEIGSPFVAESKNAVFTGFKPALQQIRGHRGGNGGGFGSHVIDEKTDIWSFGVTLYEAMSLNHPFSGKTASEIPIRTYRFRQLVPA